MHETPRHTLARTATWPRGEVTGFTDQSSLGSRDTLPLDTGRLWMEDGSYTPPSNTLGVTIEPYKIMSNSNSGGINWTFKSVRVELGVGRLVKLEFANGFVQYVRVAMRRELTANGTKHAKTDKGRDVTAKEFAPTQKTGLRGDRYTTGEKEQWLLHDCALWARQLSATDEAFSSLEKGGMLASEFSPITGSALGSHLEFLRGKFLEKAAPAPVGTLEVVKA